jgi:hypothetical protein
MLERDAALGAARSDTMGIRALVSVALVSAALAACAQHEDSSPKQTAQNTVGAQSGNAVLPQSGNAASPQTGNGAGAQDRNAAAAQDRNAATPKTGSPAALPTGSDGVRRISIDDARTAVDQGRAVIFDVRGQEAYDAGHIVGAKLVPVGEVEQRLAEFPKDKLIVTYCA